MKTVNGNNKLERQINKALKYNELVLVEDSNKYLRIEKWNESKTFFVSNESVKFGSNQYGEYAMLIPLNIAKPIFIKPWNVINAYGLDGGQVGYFVYTYKDSDAATLNDLVKGDDGVLNLNPEINNRFRIKKN